MKSQFLLPVLCCLLMLACRPADKGSQPLSAEEKKLDTLLQGLYAQNNPARNKKVLDSLMPLVPAWKNQRLQALYYRVRGEYFDYTEKYDCFDSAAACYRQSMSLLPPNDTFFLRTKLRLAVMYSLLHQHEAAIRTAKEVHTAALRPPVDTSLWSQSCIDLTLISKNTGNLDLLRQYTLESIVSSAHTSNKIRSEYNLAEYYWLAGQRDSAFAYFKDHLLPDSGQVKGDFYRDMMINYGILLHQCGHPEESQKVYKRVLYLVRHSDASVSQRISLYCDIAGAYLDMDQYPPALAWIDSAMVLAQAGHMSDDVLHLLYGKAQILQTAGQLADAFTLLDSAYQMQAALADSATAIKAHELEKKYDLQEKNHEIQELNMRTASMWRETQLQRIIVATLGLVLLLATGFAILYRQRQQLRIARDAAETARRQSQLEQRLLRTQMEPHFIFNSLAVLQSFIREGDERKSIRYISTFARLLRQSMEHSREPLVPLSQELDALRNYLQLQQMRFEGLFDYRIDCPPELLTRENLHIPPMLLQPFAENSIQHGFKGIAYRGLIEINITLHYPALHISITDNGTGLKKSSGNNDNHQSLSTRITRERLGMLSADTGVHSDLQVVAGRSRGTTVRIIVPVG